MSIIQNDISIAVYDSTGRLQSEKTERMTARRARKIALDFAVHQQRYVQIFRSGRLLCCYAPGGKITHKSTVCTPELTL